MNRAGSQGFPKQHRLRRPAEFERVFAGRVSVADGVLIVYGQPSGLPHARLGLSVSRRVGPAVVRNRWKRAIREAFRRGQLPPLDLVVIPRPTASPDAHAVQESLKTLAARVERKLARAAQQWRTSEGMAKSQIPKDK